MRIIPLGNRILVIQMKKENYITETKIELVDNSLSCGEVIEFSSTFEGVYKKGDIILYSKDAGTVQTYNGKTHIWLNGQGHYGGDVWAIIGNVKDKK
jgi:co-chaperonin GroES (HSP10)